MRVVTLVLAAVAVVLVDQLSKAGAGRHLSDGQVLVPRVLRVRHVLHDRTRPGAPVLTAVWAGALVAAVLLVQRASDPGTAAVALGSALGGGAGNLLDRWRTGGVVDFLEVPRVGVGNLADVAVVVGVVVGLLAALL